MPEETTRQAAEILGAAGEGAKDASELLNEHAVSLQEGLGVPLEGPRKISRTLGMRKRPAAP